MRLHELIDIRFQKMIAVSVCLTVTSDVVQVIRLMSPPLPPPHSSPGWLSSYTAQDMCLQQLNVYQTVVCLPSLQNPYEKGI